jgi:hypothetical protein
VLERGQPHTPGRGGHLHLLYPIGDSLLCLVLPDVGTS